MSEEAAKKWSLSSLTDAVTVGRKLKLMATESKKVVVRQNSGESIQVTK